MVGFWYSARTGAFARGLALAVLTTACATGATAGDADRNSGVSSRTMDLVLEGHLSSSCRASGGADIDFGDGLTGGITRSATFDLNCNVPFAMTVTSNGGLAHQTLPGGQGPFAGTLRYTLDVSVPTTVAGGAGPVAGGSFNSRAGSAVFLSQADAIAAGRGQIVFLTNAPEGAGLLAGDYSDTVTITIAAQ